MATEVGQESKLRDDLERIYIPHLKSQFQRAQPILFTGAGFSVDAKNAAGASLPTYGGLQRELWRLCFPGDAFEEESTLADLFEHALKRHRKALGTLLTDLLRVNASSLPEWYAQTFRLPWFRCYTLNVDDLAVAVERAFDIPRRVKTISATSSSASTEGSDETQVLEVVHLNGTLDDAPDHVTFSVTQFADRLSRPDPWYMRFVVDLLSHPIVVVGSRLDEPPLWQHLEYRGARGGRDLGELRPRSYLVTPKLAKARRALLAELNICWIPMTGEEFARRVLSELDNACEKGLGFLRAHGETRDRGAELQDVTELATNPTEQTEFLLGHEPTWSDLQSGRAIRRDSDERLWSDITAALEEDRSSLVVVTGTAGSGKSTALMGGCLKLVAEGKRVAWIDRDSNVSIHDIRRAMRATDPPKVVAIDDADVYGSSLASIVRELLEARDGLVLLVALRSTRIDRALNPSVLKDIDRRELAMPPLTDDDIDSLIQVLDEHNRLGALKGMSLGDRREVLRGQCGRQLLVAMIQATSGRKFEEKAIQELTDLEAEGARIYALVAVAHAFRFPLRRDEILLAIGGGSNETLNVVNRLLSRHIVSIRNDGLIQARHRVIAEVLHDELQKEGQMAPILAGLAFMAASKVRPDLRRSDRSWRMLRYIINHDYLLRIMGLERARNLYGTLESMLDWEFQYWLQRGSAEVEQGDLGLARLFISQARSLSADSALVETEWAYLMFREAIANPHAREAQTSVDEATTILEDLIGRHARVDSYPYHVLGSQMLAWSRRSMRKSQRKSQYLEKVIGIVEAGVRQHPREKQLRKLLEDVRREYLSIAVSGQK